MHRRITIEQGLYLTGVLVFIIGLPLTILYLKNIQAGIYPPCLFNEYLGIYCPGCGGSRAVKELLSGNFITSLYYHPLVPYAAGIYFFFMGSWTLSFLTKGHIRGIRFRNWFLYGALIVLGANFILKNLLRLIWGIALL